MKVLFSKLFTKKALFRWLVVFFSAVLLVSAGLLADYIIGSIRQKQQAEELANLRGSNGEKYVYVIHPDTGETVKILEEYATLFRLNPDLIGWIKINNTVINYPVMHTPGRQNYYLQRDFYERYSKHGTIYLKETADVNYPSDNLLLFGHRMNDGTMFSDLLKYKNREFFLENPTISFNTLTNYRNYQIMAVFEVDTADKSFFHYHSFVDGNTHSFDAYVMRCKQLSLYDTGIIAVEGDKLLTLSTCNENSETGRFVVVAKQLP